MEVKIDRLDDFGRGIAVNDGKIIFIEKAYPEDIVEIDISNSYRKYDVGTIKKIIKRGSIFSSNKCPNPCGGCNLHLSLENEIKFKDSLLKKTFKNYNIKDFVSGFRENYRNKITLHYNKVLGLYENKSNDIVDVKNCLLVTDNINKVICKLKDLVSKNKEELTIIIKDLNGILINIIGNCSLEILDLIKLTDILYINGECFTEKKYLQYNNLFIGPNSFFQVNNEITEKLYDEILLNLKESDKVIDLYSGVGSISSHISNKVSKVLGVEINEEATNLANMLNLSNCKFICGDVIKYLDLYEGYNKVVVDPPRSGLDKKLIDRLNIEKFDNIIYISCNPRTLKRDIEYLDSYKVEYIKGFNMFPYTYHVETFVLLSKRI